jgi:diguanylate cyclase (GGDEF)-like protein
VARRLAQAVRPTDIVARPGGDEFVVAVCGLRQDADAAVVGRNLLAQFDEPFDLGDNRIAHIGATIGYAMQDEDGRDTAELLRRADAAMYAGKQSGKRRIVEAPASIPAARHRLRAGTIG